MMKNFDIMGAYWKIRFLEGMHEKPIFWRGRGRGEGVGESPKKDGLDSLQI